MHFLLFLAKVSSTYEKIPILKSTKSMKDYGTIWELSKQNFKMGSQLAEKSVNIHRNRLIDENCEI